jgi:hypothetical protein
MIISCPLSILRKDATFKTLQSPSQSSQERSHLLKEVEPLNVAATVISKNGIINESAEQ